MKQIINKIIQKIPFSIGNHADLIILILVLAILFSFFNYKDYSISMSFMPTLVTLLRSVNNSNRDNNRVSTPAGFRVASTPVSNDSSKHGYVDSRIGLILSDELALDTYTKLDALEQRLYRMDKNITRIGNILIFSFWFFLILILTLVFIAAYPLETLFPDVNHHLLFAPTLTLYKSLNRYTKSELIELAKKAGVSTNKRKSSVQSGTEHLSKSELTELANYRLAELAAIKTKTPVAIHTDGKNKTTTTLYRSGTLPMLPMWVISTLLTYAHKIPVLSKIIGTLAKWYGKTTIWKLLVSFRKLFVIFNALLGILAVIKITGFGTDNILAGFYGMGAYYMEMLGSFVKRLFNWLFDLFDQRIVPNVPDNTPSGSWKGRPNASDFPSNIPPKSPSPFDLDKQTLRSIYTQQPVDINRGSNSWSFTTWLWYIGVGAATLGAVYLGAKIILDPTIVTSWLPFKGTGGDAGPAQGPAPNPDGGESIAKTVAAGVVGAYNGVMSINQTIMSYANPFNYFGGGSSSAGRGGNILGFTQDEFIEKQLIANKNFRNVNLYPFTENNPYDNWATSLRKKLFGEYSFETQERNNLLIHLDEGTNRMTIKNNKFIYVPDLEKTGLNIPIPTTPIPGTPAITLGIAPGFEADNTAMANAFSANLAHKLNTVPAVPSATPVVLEGTSEQWSIPGPSQPLAPIEVASRGGSPTGSIDVSPTSTVKPDLAPAINQIAEAVKELTTGTKELTTGTTEATPIPAGDGSNVVDVKGKGVAKPTTDNAWKTVTSKSTRHK